MQIWQHPLYLEDCKNVASLPLPWDLLQNKSIIISGATGLLGSFLVDVLSYRNQHCDMNCKIIVLCRNAERAIARFGINEHIKIKACNVADSLPDGINECNGYIVHLASNTHPVAYAQEPISTITTNIYGTKNLLDWAVKLQSKRFVLASSVEIYGQNRNDVEFFDENYCGYINSNTLRADYTESKRCSEALCQAYLKEHGVDFVIPRLSRCYGPTLLKTDTKAMSQFLFKAVRGENIVLKSQGLQYFSYTYCADAVSGILTAMLKGQNAEAYNIANVKSDIMLKDLAAIIAKAANTEVVFELPGELERAGFSTAQKARLNGDKTAALGWEMRYDIKQGVERTLTILRDSMI